MARYLAEIALLLDGLVSESDTGGRETLIVQYRTSRNYEYVLGYSPAPKSLSWKSAIRSFPKEALWTARTKITITISAGHVLYR